MKENSYSYEKRRERLTQLENEQEEFLAQKYRLFFKTSHNPNLEQFAKEHCKTEGINNQLHNFDDLVHQLQTLFSSSNSHFDFFKKLFDK